MDTQPASAASLNDRADFQATSDPAVSGWTEKQKEMIGKMGMKPE